MITVQRTPKTVIDTLKELLGDYFSKIPKFDLNFINKNQSDFDIKNVFYLLISLKLNTKVIALNAKLFSINSGTIEKNYTNLINLGISPLKIASNAQLLGRNQDTIKKNYNNLINLGISPQKIATNAHLLGSDPTTIRDNYTNLINLGISPQKILH